MVSSGYRHLLFDWGDTLMRDIPGQSGPMMNWPVVQAMPGAAAALQLLSQRFTCHLATNARDSDEAEIRQALVRGRLDQYLTRIFCFKQLKVEKPAKAYYQQICVQLDCPGTQILMIGDNLHNDVLGALDAGLTACWLNLHHGENTHGVQQVENFDMLTSWLLSGLE
ncbi:HAD family hydrolase [Bowmanella denitrificans]|uniref:HAD family hydrolase n=1 Tax=Bowmanella denitrificans TaxID=366582 RepID=A0ABN0WUP5_9ALTE